MLCRVRSQLQPRQHRLKRKARKRKIRLLRWEFQTGKIRELRTKKISRYSDVCWCIIYAKIQWCLLMHYLCKNTNQIRSSVYIDNATILNCECFYCLSWIGWSIACLVELARFLICRCSNGTLMLPDVNSSNNWRSRWNRPSIKRWWISCSTSISSSISRLWTLWSRSISPRWFLIISMVSYHLDSFLSSRWFLIISMVTYHLDSFLSSRWFLIISMVSYHLDGFLSSRWFLIISMVSYHLDGYLSSRWFLIISMVSYHLDGFLSSRWFLIISMVSYHLDGFLSSRWFLIISMVSYHLDGFLSSRWFLIISMVTYHLDGFLSSRWFLIISMASYHLDGFLSSRWLLIISMVSYHLDGYLSSRWFLIISMVSYQLDGFISLLAFILLIKLICLWFSTMWWLISSARFVGGLTPLWCLSTPQVFIEPHTGLVKNTLLPPFWFYHKTITAYKDLWCHEVRDETKVPNKLWTVLLVRIDHGSSCLDWELNGFGGPKLDSL